MNLKVLQAIEAEYERAKIKYPWWPSDPVHAIAIAWEEKGELIQACNDHVHPQCNHLGDDTLSRMYKEAVQMGAMAVRFLENMEAYTDPARRVEYDPTSYADMADYIRGDAREVDDDLK